MSEHDENSSVPTPETSEGAGSFLVHSPVHGMRHWLGRFFACNPFYLLSAGLLLFGVYRISADHSVFSRETSQLAFNFGALQIYELLLVATAVLLARRHVWYDSTLLVSLENLLLLVPFILISQAGLIDPRAVGWLSILAGVMVLARFGTLRLSLRELNLPNRALFIATLVVLVNIAFLVLHRHLQDTRTPAWGPAYEMNEWCWMLGLPAVFVMGCFLPIAKEVGTLLPQHRWLPAGFFTLWALGTGVHLYSLNYVYDFVLRRELLAPTLWVLAWTAAWRASDFIPTLKPNLKRALLILPAIAALVAVQNQNRVLFALALLNAAIYGVVLWQGRDRRVTLHLLFASVVMCVAALPVQLPHGPLSSFTNTKALALAVAGYIVIWTASSRHPKAGLLGALVCATGLMTIAKDPVTAHLAFQAGFLFFLLHSLGWDDTAHAGAAFSRLVVALAWVAHAMLLVSFEAPLWMTTAAGAIAAVGCVIAKIFRGRWELILLTSAVLVGLAGPGNLLVGVIRIAPGGLLAVAGSFLLFGAGTALALWKGKKQHSLARAPIGSRSV